MRGAALKVAALLAAAGVTAAGVDGAYSYGRDYDLHRGFSTLVQLPRAGTGRLLEVNFYSTALRRRADYLVYLPPHYSRQRRYPVYYLLHGMPGQPRVFVNIANMDVRLDNQLSLGRARPMILVYPDGRIGGSIFSDSEWANTPSGEFESYVIDVMHNVDRRFATIPRRADRVIAGFSAGAYGALNIALHHLADFGNVQSWSGYFTQTRTGVFRRARRATLAYNSPLYFAWGHRRSLSANPLRVYMFVGRDDDASSGQQAMIAALRAGDAEVQYRVYPGGHDWSVWYPRLNEMLDLASHDAGHPPARSTTGYVAAVSRPAPVARGHRQRRSELRLLGALLLALISAALINVGFVLQHRGHARATALGRPGLLGGFRQPVWLSGQAVGWIGFIGQIVAVALAPLTLVQAFSAGSLALSVPLVAAVFGHRVNREQLVAIAVIAVSLVSLPIGFAGGDGRLHSGLLIVAALTVMLTAGLLAPAMGSVALAIAAGALYGAADAAIKADAVTLHAHGAPALASGWTILAALCTFAGFLSFQAALRDQDAVRPMTVMNAFTSVTAVALGIVGFGESLGTSPAAGIAHGIAIGLVLACVRPLAGAQQRLAAVAPLPASSPPEPSGSIARSRLRGGLSPALRSAVRAAAWSLFIALALLISALAMLGLVYMLRERHWIGIGPRVADSLPLLQLAGFAGQPLGRVVVAGLASGAALGVGLIRLSRRRRLIVVGVLAPLLLLFASDASYAVARNLPLGHVLLDRSPGVGPWLEGLLLAIACALAPPRPSLGFGGFVRWLHGRARAWGRRGDRTRPIVGEGLLVVTPLLAIGFTLAVLAALVLPRDHARAEAPMARRAATTSPAPGRLFTVHFYSEALRREADYLVYLPREYNPAHRLPAFYMLHGMPGRPLAFTVNAGIEPKLERLIGRHLVSPMILVFPDGRIDGRTHTDSEWANTPSGRFESYVVDVVHDVDGRFATLPYQQDRAIAGLSAGAYGAANIGLHQVALFGLIQVWSGYFTQTPTGVFAAATRAQLAYNSPIDYVRGMRRELERYRLRLFIYVGRGDSDRDQVEPMAAALRAAGADVRYAIYAGGHSWKLWSPRVDRMLIMASRDFAAARPLSSTP